ncbi:MAG TPA: TolC family outer membrane protein [Bradyrhizobium sp.]|uniref:TolC family outer membrane protein n=1 Tax=Bradyrhizobium sp. TaxID=376 RepID=UPI002D7F2C51|nr:TolC family outer membrane protein [Bradyrhizobium sp.]HET7888992.1 TolC family outer membrane protein [Bradyrhizobium sp.]
MLGGRVLGRLVAAVVLLGQTAVLHAHADTMEAALLRAYQNNPQLNAQRASVRATDEAVPQALAGYRPKAAMALSGGGQFIDQLSHTVGGKKIEQGDQGPHAAALTVTQTLYNGNQTANKTRAAESQVLGAREGLRLMEQSVLLAAATIYMDYLRDAAILEVQRSNVKVLELTLNQTRQRYSAGLVTPTDVAQSQAQLAAGQSQEQAAESTLTTTRANFRRIIGNEPSNLQAASPVDRYLPTTVRGATQIALRENPNVTAATYGIDVSFLTVKINEGALYPTLTVQATVSKVWQQTITQINQFTAATSAQLTVPIYQGGAEYSLIRQSKETLEQQRLTMEQIRDQARADLVTAWGQLVASKAQVSAAQSQVEASELAYLGTTKEAQVGQRTVIDILNAQQTLVNARVALVTAQHDRVVASYAVLNAMGRLSPQLLRLSTQTYDPSVHYQQVRDNWAGTRTPDGR